MTLDELIQKLNDERAHNQQAEEDIRQSDEEINATFAKIDTYQSILELIRSVTDEWHLIDNSDFVFDTNVSESDSAYKGSSYNLNKITFTKIKGDGQNILYFIPSYNNQDYYKSAANEMKIIMLNSRYRLLQIYNAQAEELRKELGIDESVDNKKGKKIKLIKS